MSEENTQSGFLNADIEVAVNIREDVLSKKLDKATTRAVLEWMLEWNKNRPAPSV